MIQAYAILATVAAVALFAALWFACCGVARREDRIAALEAECINLTLQLIRVGREKAELVERLVEWRLS